jgi:hypothetical protein
MAAARVVSIMCLLVTVLVDKARGCTIDIYNHTNKSAIVVQILDSNGTAMTHPTTLYQGLPTHLSINMGIMFCQQPMMMSIYIPGEGSKNRIIGTNGDNIFEILNADLP